MNHSSVRPSASVADRPLPHRCRSDLTLVPVWFRNERWYVAKDPLSLQYTRLRCDEYHVLRSLDGRATLRSLQSSYTRAFPTHRVSLVQLQALLDRLQKLNLVVVAGHGQSDVLRDQARREQQRKRLDTVSNLLFLKLPGVNPEPLLAPLNRFLGWIFAPWTIVAVLISLVLTLLVWITHPTDVARRLPELESLFSTAGVATLVLVVAITKVCHELGHALACKRFGGECHQIGPLLMIFTPTLYCDTSDTWLLPDKWQRAMVGAAGVYIELILATLAAWCWWWTEPGMLHYLSLRIVLVCSISTLLVNANPLLRYDGYFVLSDLWGVPNLAEDSRRLWQQDLRRYFFRENSANHPRRSVHATLLRWYAAASYAYRLLLVISIALLLYRWLRPSEFGVMGFPLFAGLLFGITWGPVRSIGRIAASPAMRANVRAGRVTLVVMLLLALFAFLAFAPLPHCVRARGVLESLDRVHVHTLVSGMIAETHVAPRALVEQGQPLVTLKSAGLELEYEQVKGRRDLQALEVDALRLRQRVDDRAAEQLPAAIATLEDLEEQLRKVQRNLASLTVLAPQSGRVLSPLKRMSPSSSDLLPTWEELPLDSVNRGAYLEPGTVICAIGSPTAWSAQVVVSEADRSRIQPGQRVDVVCSSFPRQPLRGTVRGVSLGSLDAIPERMTAQAIVAVDPHDPEGRRPLQASYLVSIELDQTPLPLHEGSTLETRIEVNRLSLGTRLLHAVLHTFRFY